MRQPILATVVNVIDVEITHDEGPKYRGTAYACVRGFTCLRALRRSRH